MARKSKTEAQLTRGGILDAAEEVFRSKGVARTRLEDIAQRAGCTRGAVYWHFKNKTTVLSAMFDRIALPLYDSIQQLAATQHADPLSAWSAHLIESMRRIEQDCQQQNVFDILMNRCELTEELAPLIESERQRHRLFVGVTERLLEQARTAGQIDKSIDIPMVAKIVHATIHGLIRAWLAHPGQLLPHTAVGAYIGMLIGGIGTELSPSSATPSARVRTSSRRRTPRPASLRSRP